jgi:release factor H-coupled RctB family protein
MCLPHHWQGQDGFLHRKGATPADRGLVVIPGSRGDYSYLVRPVAGRHEALDSLAHGAGRKWARTDCMGRLRPRFTLDELLRTRFGSAVVCADRELVYEEAPRPTRMWTPWSPACSKPAWWSWSRVSSPC